MKSLTLDMKPVRASGSFTISGPMFFKTSLRNAAIISLRAFFKSALVEAEPTLPDARPLKSIAPKVSAAPPFTFPPPEIRDDCSVVTVALMAIGLIPARFIKPSIRGFNRFQIGVNAIFSNLNPLTIRSTAKDRTPPNNSANLDQTGMK